MAATPAQRPFLLFKYSVLICTFFTFLAWLLLLGGISALESVCNGGCRALYGLAWFIIWFQFVLILLVFAVELADRFVAFRPCLTILLAINTVLVIIESNRFLDRKDVVGGVRGSRINSAIAGFVILSIFNLLLIILSGSRTALHARYGEDRDVGVATYPTKNQQTNPMGPEVSQVTVPPPQSTYGTTAPTSAV